MTSIEVILIPLPEDVVLAWTLRERDVGVTGVIRGGGDEEDREEVKAWPKKQDSIYVQPPRRK